ncbi:repeatdomain containing protein [Pyrenophora tritici-repentis]|uniref:DUF3433 domain containing protein n=1 Tax=Pyrenophora tritici-repentis TaxID=45151 RepID=A0A2W1HVV4_9PLEO|nr:DUF3433 domain containing protein [Pyrenophora tritici-repentis]KAI0578588.1 DUF3433 domain-containing protein [Pyrenophora tritici-repentis]KAI1552497.1 repeatdomain containing protein [Pyrenophora tritici-repentis]KAI1589415.1 repeatdomain containing protein [Pyrenophora tritici-repentis]PZD28253.1 DUF3433 domain containing protein [Pyrenophora tritici-repentis]
MASDASVAPVAHTIGPKKSNTIISIFTRSSGDQPTKTWKPAALRTPVLILTIAICWSLIAVLQFLLHKSQHDSGIIFAPRISDLPISRTFLYLYFPTVLSVIFSMYWAWIDLDTKRMEPYYQLSKDEGALGKDSLLLQYPFDFLPLVPMKAARDRHWPVFWASIAVVLVTWGLVPTQAGIFSVKQVTRTTNATFAFSNSSVPSVEQARTLTLRYAQSTYGIAALNETLPPFMARNYTLRPFAQTGASLDADASGKTPNRSTWTAATTMYFMDLYCENVSHKADNSEDVFFVSNSGCNFTLGLTGNLTRGENPNQGMEGDTLSIKKYMGMYVGYSDPNGFSDYSLDWACPKNQSSIFYAAFQENKEREEDPPQDVTAVYCQPRYHQQAVSATVDALTQKPIAVKPMGDVQALATGIFNSSTFETLLTSGSLGNEVRSDILPAKSAPSYVDIIAGSELSQTSGPNGIATVQPMVGLAVAAGNRSLEDYLDWQVLSKSYADAYRLIFARAMVEVLNASSAEALNTSDSTFGQQKVTTEAVVLEPVFVYIVEGFLGVVSLCTIALLYLTFTRKRNLCSNPSTIASIMSLVADCQPLLADFQSLDCCTMDEIRDLIGEKRYKLFDDGSQPGIVEYAQSLDGLGDPIPTTTVPSRQNTSAEIAKPVRPSEFSIWMAFLLVSLFTALVVTLAILFAKAKLQGLPLPSSNSLVQNILENYLPTAIATLIEPIWLLLNRLLCMLQPLEELQNCDAHAKNSIDLDYSSLPPQLALFKALRSKHLVLASVCAMALLANLLAISLSGLFNQATVDIRHSTMFKSPLDLKFVPINGTIGPDPSQQIFGSMQTSGAYMGGDGQDQFLVSESNYTRGTPLPAWTDDKLFYQPFLPDHNIPINGSVFEGVTKAFGAELDCSKLEIGNSFQAGLEFYTNSITAIVPSVNITVTSGSSRFQCTGLPNTLLRPGGIGSGCARGPSAAELVLLLKPKNYNATRAEVEACRQNVVLGWLRSTRDCRDIHPQPLTSANATFMQCKPRWITGTARIRVDADGRLREKAKDLHLKTVADADTNTLGQIFSNDPVNLIGQSSLYLFQGHSPGWHNDSFADDFLNYFVVRAANNSDMINNTLAVPTFDMLTGPVNKAYSSLFAIWLGVNKNRLLVTNTKQLQSAIEGWIIDPEKRVFVSTPMFAISEAILGTYIIVAVLVYMRRPGQYLPRLPTSIASLVALFAASSAVQDMQNTSHLNRKGRAQHLRELDTRYGYGSFIGGGDGRVHIGIERTPFIRRRTKTTWFEKKLPLFRKP